MKEKTRSFVWRITAVAKDSFTILAASITVGCAIPRLLDKYVSYIPACLRDPSWEQFQKLVDLANKHLTNYAPIYYISIGFLISYLLMGWYEGMRCTRRIRKIVCGCHRLNTKKYIKKAKKYIILNSTIHPDIIQNTEMWDIIEEQMTRNEDLKLIVIHPDLSKIATDECDSIFDKSLKDLEGSLSIESRRLNTLKDNYASGRVIVYKTGAFPLTPMLVLDDHLMYSNQLHSFKSAQTGIWIHLKHEKIISILDEMTSGVEASIKRKNISPTYNALSADEKKLLRPLWDIYYCMSNS